MVNTRKLIKMAIKWQMTVALRRKLVSFPVVILEGYSTTNYGSSTGRQRRRYCTSSSPTMAEKGHFVVYTADQKRYSFPIAYLNNYIFVELFRMAEEEFGLPSDGPITVPCDAVFMDYLVSLMQRKATKDIEKALLFAACRCSSSNYFIHQNWEINNYQLLLCSI